MSGSEYRVGRRAPFTMVPQALLEDDQVDAHAIATYVALRSFADFSSGGGARPSDRQAAHRAGCSVRTLFDRRKLLRDLGWIEWESRAERGLPNLYIIHETTLEQEAIEEAGGTQDTQTPSAGDADPPRSTRRPPRQEAQTGSAGGADNRDIYNTTTATSGPGQNVSQGEAAEREPHEAEMLADLEKHLASIEDDLEVQKIAAHCQLIIDGDDRKAWETPDGSTVPADERPELFRLALGYHADGTQRAFRSSLRYVVGIYSAPDPPQEAGTGAQKLRSGGVRLPDGRKITAKQAAALERVQKKLAGKVGV